jgi:hypothetical protein
MIDIIKKQFVVGFSLMSMLLVPSCFQSRDFSIENFDNKIAERKVLGREVSYNEFSQALLFMGFKEDEVGEFSIKYPSTEDGLEPVFVTVTLWKNQNGSLHIADSTDSTLISVTASISRRFNPKQNTGKNSLRDFTDAVLENKNEHIEDSQSVMERVEARTKESSSKRGAKTFFNVLKVWNAEAYGGSEDNLNRLVRENLSQMSQDYDFSYIVITDTISKTPWGLISLAVGNVEGLSSEFRVEF